MFDTHQLRLLYELQLRGTMTAVAQALAFSPSTISQQLAQLEKEAGVALFAPEGRRVTLTAQGELLAQHAARVLALEEAVRASLESPRPIAPVRIAVLQTAARAVVPHALALLRDTQPELRIEVAERPPEVGLFELTARGVDLVMAEQYPGRTRELHRGMIRKTVGFDPIRLALPPHDDAADIRQLAERPWVMEPTGTESRAWALQQCRAAGFEPDVRYSVADLSVHARLIASGHAVGIVPDLVWEGGAAPVKLIRLPKAPQRELFVAYRQAAAARPALTQVREALTEALQQLQRG